MATKSPMKVTMRTGDKMIVEVNGKEVLLTTEERKNGNVVEAVLTVENLEESCEIVTEDATDANGAQAIFYI